MNIFEFVFPSGCFLMCISDPSTSDAEYDDKDFNICDHTHAHTSVSHYKVRWGDSPQANNKIL